MKQIVFLLLIVCLFTVSNAQDVGEYREVDRLALGIPALMETSTDSIARYVKLHFDTERNKARAAYAWVTANLKYSKDSANIINSEFYPDAKVTFALRRRKGVCENFAAIFNDICLKAGLTSFVITGYTRQAASIGGTGHSWCAVSVDKKWYLFDPTWDEGSGLNSKYFLVEPSEFIETHMPFDPLWQLLDYPVSHEQFYSGNVYRKTATPYFNSPDSVTAYFQMDSLHRLLSTEARIQKYRLYNSLVKDNYNYVRMNIEIIDQDRDANLYNATLEELNNVTEILNNFIEYRNKQFIPEKTDAEIMSLLDGIDNKVDLCLKNLDEVDHSPATLTLNTQPVRRRLNALTQKIKDQKDFLNRYLATAKGDRKSLFY